MTALREIIEKEVNAAEELPLVHTTRCETLAFIVKSHELRSPNPCDVFGEHLLYFFYGRPAYRYKGGADASADVDLYPVCFVFKPNTISAKVKRIYACDSGGVQKGYFENHLHPPDRDELQLDPKIDSARKLVRLVFGDNSQYYRASAVGVAPAAFVSGTPAARYHALLIDKARSAADDRRSAIEVQLDSPLALGHDLLYVVLPKEKLNEPDLRETIIQNWQADPIGYETYPGAPPHEYISAIREALRRRFEEGGRL